MLLKVKKRDGREVSFDKSKITAAIYKAALAVGGEDYQTAEDLTDQVVGYLMAQFHHSTPFVEEVQDIVEKILIENGHARTAKAYILYRAQRNKIREAKSDLMDAVREILVETSRDNANVGNSPSAKMLQIASAASKKYYLSNVIPEEYAQAHLHGDMHIHDLDFYSKTLNCLQIPLGRLLATGFNTGYGFIRPPKRVSTAMAQAAIILQSNQNDMFGGQSFPHFDHDISTYVQEQLGGECNEDDIWQATEGLVYNLNTMHSRAGAQVPFSSINLGTDTSQVGRTIIEAILRAFEKGLGRGESPIFPNLVFRLKKGINFNPEDPNYDMFRYALKVAGKRMNPTFSFMDASFNAQYGREVAYMGCRTRVIGNRHGEEIATGRGNVCPVSLNLPRVALKVRRDNQSASPYEKMTKFFAELDALMEIGAGQLLHRFDLLGRLKVRDVPFLMSQRLYMGSEKLADDEPIREAIKNGTLSIGIIGLAETLIALTGKHHGEDRGAQELGLEIIAWMRRKTDYLSEKHDLNFTLYATPAEGLSGRFTPMDRNEFGVVPGVTDKEYYTNSFHVPVSHEIGIYDKIAIEGPYHKYCNAGHIAYVELPSPIENNIEAAEAILRHMAASDVGYGAINFPIDSCAMCGYQGVINTPRCPACDSPAIRRIRRITGYLSTTDRFNDAKLAELRDRRPHGFRGCVD